MSGEIVMEPRVAWVCMDAHEFMTYTDDEWVDEFGNVPTDQCPICFRHQSNRGCGWWRLTQVVRMPSVLSGETYVAL